MHAYTYVNVHLHYPYIHIYIHSRIRKYICICIYIHSFLSSYIPTYILHIHTYTNHMHHIQVTVRKIGQKTSRVAWAAQGEGLYRPDHRTLEEERIQNQADRKRYVCMYVWSMCILSTVSEISLWMLVSSYCRLFIKRTYIHVYTVYCTYIHTYPEFLYMSKDAWPWTKWYLTYAS